MPTLMLTGDADLYMPPSLLRTIAPRIRGAKTLIVPECGHSAFWEQPEAMVAEGIPVSAGYRNAINYGLQYYRERKTFGSSGFPWGHVVGGRQIEWREYAYPTVERIARSLLLLEIHESWTEREAADTAAAFRKVEAAYRR